MSANFITTQPDSQVIPWEVDLRGGSNTEPTFVANFDSSSSEQPSAPPAYESTTNAAEIDRVDLGNSDNSNSNGKPSTMLQRRRQLVTSTKAYKEAFATFKNERNTDLPEVNEYNRCYNACLCDECCCAPDFRNGLCACCTCTVCWTLPCMLPCMLAELNAALSKRPAECSELICCPSLYSMRTTLRHQRGYEPRPYSDCAAVACFFPCATYQTFAEAGLRYNCCDGNSGSNGSKDSGTCYYLNTPSGDSGDNDCCACNGPDATGVPQISCPGRTGCYLDGCGCDLGCFNFKLCTCDDCCDNKGQVVLDCDCCTGNNGCGIGNSDCSCKACACPELAPDDDDLCLGCDRLCSGEGAQACDGDCGTCIGECFDACCDCRTSTGECGCDCKGGGCNCCDCGGCDCDCNC
eukprot:TRINITY_DN6341_c0_g2_i1.p1 TRINITY_DN6341_c0_g2~~TRINITY_DN6341_c0_g2_i1.p1  ORF type:complete len:407 (+),score=41.11 TRINITY_DN6341_c0_g2_i1:129-1349(+)